MLGGPSTIAGPQQHLAPQLWQHCGGGHKNVNKVEKGFAALQHGFAALRRPGRQGCTYAKVCRYAGEQVTLRRHIDDDEAMKVTS